MENWAQLMRRLLWFGLITARNSYHHDVSFVRPISSRFELENCPQSKAYASFKWWCRRSCGGSRVAHILGRLNYSFVIRRSSIPSGHSVCGITNINNYLCQNAEIDEGRQPTTPSHSPTHTQTRHTHTQAQHTHTQTQHTHTQPEHTHTQSEHTHSRKPSPLWRNQIQAALGLRRQSWSTKLYKFSWGMERYVVSSTMILNTSTRQELCKRPNINVKD